MPDERIMVHDSPGYRVWVSPSIRKKGAWAIWVNGLNIHSRATMKGAIAQAKRYVMEHTGKRNPAVRYARNVAGYMDSSGRFRPIRDDDDYDPGRLAPEALIKESKRVQRLEGLTRGRKSKGRGKGKGKGKRNPTLFLPPYFRLSYSPTTGESTLYRRGQYEGTFSTKEAAKKRAWDINSFAPITRRKRAGRRNPISTRIMKGIETATSFLKARGFPVDRLKVSNVGPGKVGVKAEGSRGTVRFTVKD